jgi:hypothetical protein
LAIQRVITLIIRFEIVDWMFLSIELDVVFWCRAASGTGRGDGKA